MTVKTEAYALLPYVGPLRAGWIVERLVLPLIRGKKTYSITVKHFLGTMYAVGAYEDLKRGLPALERQPWRRGC